MEHLDVAVPQQHDGAVRVGIDLTALAARPADDPTEPDLFASGRNTACASQVTGDRRAVPGGAETPGVEVLEPGAVPDVVRDGRGGDDAAGPGPVRVGAAVQRAFRMKTLTDEQIGQVQHLDPVRPELIVEGLVVGVEARYRDRDADGSGDLLREDGCLWRHGHQQQFDPERIELPFEVEDGGARVRTVPPRGSGHRRGIGLPERACAQVPQFRAEEYPAIHAGDSNSGLLIRFVRELPQFGPKRGNDLVNRGSTASDTQQGDEPETVCREISHGVDSSSHQAAATSAVPFTWRPLPAPPRCARARTASG